MNGQHAGSSDDMALRVGRSSDAESDLKVSGWFTVTHTSAKTGEETDHSGKNFLTRDGLACLHSGLNPGVTGFPAATAGNTNCGIWLSGVDTAITAGIDALVGTYTQTATPVGTTGDVIGPWTNTALGNGTTSTPDSSVSMFFKSSAGGDPGTDPVDIFDAASSDVAAMATSIATITVKNLGATQRTVDAIFIADCSGTAGATVKLLAGRASASAGNGDMTPVIMNQNDTLAIDYTITITAT